MLLVLERTFVKEYVVLILLLLDSKNPHHFQIDIGVSLIQFEYKDKGWSTGAVGQGEYVNNPAIFQKVSEIFSDELS